jgi:hypothetical protein
MSAMTEREFGTIFTILAIQLRWTDSDEVTIRSYFEALHGEPIESVKASAQAFGRETGRRFFPTTPEWLEASRQVQTETLRKALPAAREQPGSHDCEHCEDTGFEPYDCDGTNCGRKFKHVAHGYVRLCPCRPTNATWARHQRFGSGAA